MPPPPQIALALAGAAVAAVFAASAAPLGALRAQQTPVPAAAPSREGELVSWLRKAAAARLDTAALLVKQARIVDNLRAERERVQNELAKIEANCAALLQAAAAAETAGRWPVIWERAAYSKDNFRVLYSQEARKKNFRLSRAAQCSKEIAAEDDKLQKMNLLYRQMEEEAEVIKSDIRDIQRRGDRREMSNLTGKIAGTDIAAYVNRIKELERPTLSDSAQEAQPPPLSDGQISAAEFDSLIKRQAAGQKTAQPPPPPKNPPRDKESAN